MKQRNGWSVCIYHFINISVVGSKIYAKARCRQDNTFFYAVAISSLRGKQRMVTRDGSTSGVREDDGFLIENSSFPSYREAVAAVKKAFGKYVPITIRFDKKLIRYHLLH